MLVDVERCECPVFLVFAEKAGTQRLFIVHQLHCSISGIGLAFPPDNIWCSSFRTGVCLILVFSRVLLWVIIELLDELF